MSGFSGSAVSVDWLTVLVAAVAVCGLVGIWWPRREDLPAAGPRWAWELTPIVVLLSLGAWETQALIEVLNPHFVPVGRDASEHLKLILYYAADMDFQPSGFRYPLAPLSAACLGRLTGQPPAVAGIQLSLFAHALLPTAAYLVGRQLAGRWIGFAGALPVLHLPFLVGSLGYPWDYTLNALLGTALVAGVLAAVRTGHRWAFGVTGLLLALTLAGAGRAVVLAVLVLVVAVAALPWEHARARLQALGLLLGPVVTAWVLFALFAPPLFSVEYAVAVVDRDFTFNQGLEAQPGQVAAHEEPSLQPSQPSGAITPEQSGWVFGRATSLGGLPRTFLRLSQAPEHRPAWRVRVASAMEGLARDLGLGSSLLLALAPFAALWGAAVAQRRRGALLAGFLLALLLLHAQSALRLLWVSRYSMQLLVLAPTLALAGCAAPLALLRRMPRGRPAWLAMPVAVVAVLVLVFPGSGVSFRAARSSAILELRHDVGHAADPARGLLAEGDAVVDVSIDRCPALYHLNRRDLVFGRFSAGELPPITVPGSAHARRFVVLCGVTPTWDAALRAELEASARFEPVSPGVFRDLRPGEDVVLLADWVSAGPLPPVR